MTRRGLSFEERFWMKVEKTEGCWNWTASTNGKGYGRIGTGAPLNGFVSAHRASYEMVHGPIPEGRVVDHKCHNRSCVNPEHLRLATLTENGQNRQGATILSSSGHRGVSWHKGTQKWQVKAMKDGQLHNGGLYADIEEAAQAAQALRERLKVAA